MSYVEPFVTKKYPMPPKTRKKQNSGEDLLPFRTTSPDAKMLQQLLVATPERYLTDIKCLRRPAEVTDKVRKVHARYLLYCRDSMKGAMARILKEEDIKGEIVRKMENAMNDDDDDDDDDSIVSNNEWIIDFLGLFYTLLTNTTTRLSLM